ncbi:MAG: hypothetical protein HGA33_01100 [Candidatus Moranbacteria bacterium]|nr:hypothetical protein [Candidatus Moranbacteria bacterium]
MPGMNLAQSAQQGKMGSGKRVGPGLLFLLSVVVAVVVIWAALAIYERMLSAGISEIESRIVERRESLSPGKVDQVTDFHFRIERIAEDRHADFGLVESLDSIEKLILPGVTLSEYSYDAEKSTIRLRGEADSFRTVVQQMTVFKKTATLSALSVPSLERNDAGRVDFSFSSVFGEQ